MCNLLHSKVFPNSPFSSSSTPSSPSSHTTSPDASILSKCPINTSSKLAQHWEHSPALSTTSQAQVGHRLRSRSLSVSLAEERVRERERGVGVRTKRALNREVSMSRGFKPKPKGPPGQMKRKTQPNIEKKVSTEGVTLVEATPTKRKSITKMLLPPQTMLSGESDEYGMSNRSSSRPLFGAGLQGDDEDDEWLLSSTPDVLKLGGLGADGLSSDEEVRAGGDRFSPVLVCDTPTKRARL